VTTKPARQRKPNPLVEDEEQRRKRQREEWRRRRQAARAKALASVVPEYLSAQTAGAMFGISPWSMRELIRTGKIAGKRYGRRVLPAYKSCLEYFGNLPDAKTTRPSAV
jgi:hypothetical protein